MDDSARARLPGTVWVIVYAALLGAAVLQTPGVMAAGPTPGRQAPTDVRLFVPLLAGKLASGLTAASRVTGKCFTASLASQGRPDAWRCMAGNTILDPCYEAQPPVPGPLACPDSPWSPRVVLLTPTDPIPRDQANHGDLLFHLPWALELADRSRCTFLTGATGAVAGMRWNYVCENGASVVGDIDRSQPIWRAFEHPKSGPVVRQVDVAVAWY